MINQELFQAPKRFRYTVLGIAVAAILLLGVLIALRFPVYRQQSITTPGREGAPVFIDHITFGRLINPEHKNRPNPRIEEARSYTTNDYFILRVTTRDNVTTPTEVVVRLQSDRGEILPLSPSSARFQPGTSSFCCWQIPTPGTYTFQVLHPNGGITSFPILVNRGHQEFQSVL